MFSAIETTDSAVRTSAGRHLRGADMKRLRALLLSLLVAGGVAVAPPGGRSAGATSASTVYIFDKGHTQVGFSWERTGLSRQQGRFTDVSGTIEFSPEAPETSRIDVTIRAASLQTGVDVLDRHLRSSDFFDVANHPVITFKGTQVTKTGDKSGDVTGDLTILGVTKPVTLQVTWMFTGPHPLGKANAAYRDKTVSVFSAKGSLKRSAWGLDRIIPMVGDDIQISIETELITK
jgi:polyisoprenoid-binding protein YceI